MTSHAREGDGMTGRYVRRKEPTERFWLEETDPAELERRARDWEATSHFGLAEEFRERAAFLRAAQTKGEPE